MHYILNNAVKHRGSDYKKSSQLPAFIWRDPLHFLACGFGSGAMPWAPGTFGTLIAIPIYLLLCGINIWFYLAILCVGIVVGIWLCERTEKAIKVPDHSGIVWDEILGYLLTMLGLPHGIWWILSGFLLFRLFDIWKPWPISYVNQHVHGGLGIVLDDLFAAIPALIVLQAANFLL